jgi:hypothetical protein
MKEKRYRVTGRVIDKQTGRGIPGLFVEAWDRDLRFDDPLGRALSDENGVFEFSFHARELRDDPKDRGPDLYVKVSRGEKLLRSTEAEIKWDLAEDETAFTIEIEERLPLEFAVRGQVLQPDGSPEAGLTVRVFDKHTLLIEKCESAEPNNARKKWRTRS